jgi:hypothetical protein
MAAQNISLDNADTSSVIYGGDGVDKEVCYLVIDGQEVWRKNPKMPNVYIRRIQRGGDGDSHTTIYNPGFGFPSASQVTSWLNGSSMTNNLGMTDVYGDYKNRSITWRGCTLNSTGGIATIFASNGTRSDYLSAQSGSDEDDDDEGDKNMSWVLGNKGTILGAYNVLTYTSGSRRGQKYLRTVYNWSDAYVPISSTFSNRSDVTLVSGATMMSINTFDLGNAEITGKDCGESFARLSILATESGGAAD